MRKVGDRYFYDKGKIPIRII